MIGAGFSVGAGSRPNFLTLRGIGRIGSVVITGGEGEVFIANLPQISDPQAKGADGEAAVTVLPKISDMRAI